MDLANINNDRKAKRKTTLDLSNMVYGKVPPQSIELESEVLGAIMLEKHCFDVVADILKAESFYTDANQRIFKAMMSLSSGNNPIDLMTVVEQLKKTEELELVGGPYYISKLTNSVKSTAGLDYHARLVSEKFIKREIIRIGGEMVSAGYDESTDAFEIQDDAEAAISKLIQGNTIKDIISLSAAVVKSIHRIEELRKLESHITGIPSRFIELDRLTHGWQDTDLIILAARPSVGKTAFAGNLGISAASYFYEKYLIERKGKQTVAFFSLEMSTGQLIERIISAESGITLDQIKGGRIDDEEMKIIYQTSERIINELPLLIDDTPGLSISQLRSKCRKLKNKQNLGMVIIDYLQLMSGAGENKNGNREQEISKISRDLKGLAKELTVPIIALSQLSRKVEERKEKTPILSDLRESGAIEQDADMVMFMYRPEYYDITANELGESTNGETHIKIAKHRNGDLDTIKLQAKLSIQKFYDWDGNQSFQQAKQIWTPVKHYQETDKDGPF